MFFSDAFEKNLLSFIDGVFFWCFCKSEIKYFWPVTTVRWQGVKPSLGISQWRRLYQTSGLWSCVNAGDLKIKLTRNSSQHLGRLLHPKTLDQECFFLCFLLSVTVLFLILTQWRSSWFFCLPLSLPCPEKIIPLFTYLRQLQRRVIQLPTDFWIGYDAGDLVVLSARHTLLPDFQCLSFSETSSLDKHFCRNGDTVTWDNK